MILLALNGESVRLKKKKEMTLKFILQLKDWKRTIVLHFDFPDCENTVSAQMLAKFWENISECFWVAEGGSSIAGALYAGVPGFQL